MSLTSIAQDIRRYASAALNEHGITVVEVPTQSPDVEDDEIEFHLKDGNKLAVSMQVSSLSSGHWNDAVCNISVFHEKPLSDTGFSYRALEGTMHVELAGSVAQRVDRIVTEIEKSKFGVEPKDSLQDKVVTDIRMPEVVASLEKMRDALTGQGEIKFADNDGIINKVTLYCDDVEFLRVEFQEYKAKVTNVLREEAKDVSGVKAIQDAIEELGLASYSASPKR
jgi:hypothetical protein